MSDIEIFVDKDMSTELVGSLKEITRQKEIAITAFNTASEQIRKCDERFWDLVSLAMPEYNTHYVNVNLETGKIHAESEK